MISKEWAKKSVVLCSHDKVPGDNVPVHTPTDTACSDTAKMQTDKKKGASSSQRN
jgi:hypothetical protein